MDRAYQAGYLLSNDNDPSIAPEAKPMNTYAILTRFGHYFEVVAWDEDHAREEAQKDIDAGECPQPGDAIEHIDEIAGLSALVGDIRSDLAEIMAK
jgi:hypothetical protein